MQALVLEKQHDLKIRDIDVEEKMGPFDVRIAIHTVGICGSDVHYYENGRIGPFVVREPMIMGHEASGRIVEVGSEVTTLKVGDRVCMEPGIPDPDSRATRLGIYNVDPAVRFWATPPVHGILRPTVVHPELFTFKLPDNVSFAEAAMVEPLAVGVHGATKAAVKPGDVGLVIGAGPIGLMSLAVLRWRGFDDVAIFDLSDKRLGIARELGAALALNAGANDVWRALHELHGTEKWMGIVPCAGTNAYIEASGAPSVIGDIIRNARSRARISQTANRAWQKKACAMRWMRLRTTSPCVPSSGSSRTRRATPNRRWRCSKKQ